MEVYNSLRKTFTDKELAESYVFPASDVTAEELELFKKTRADVIRNQTQEERITLNILRFKFSIEDYINSENYDKHRTFGDYLRQYISYLNTPLKNFAEDIGITPVELSHYLSGRRAPTDDLIMRLEIHSNNNIPAIYWCRIFEKERENEIIHNPILRQKALSKVKKKLTFTL